MLYDKVSCNKYYDEDHYYAEIVKEWKIHEEYKQMTEASKAFSKESLSYIHMSSFALICAVISK